MIRRRELIQGGALSAGVLAMGPSFWRSALAATPTTRAVSGPYGPLGPPDANGVAVPSGFTVKLIGRAGVPVENTTYPWHIFPDGCATFATPGGGFVLAVNSEVPGGMGGVSAITFDKDARIVSAQRVLANTSSNCSGGATPWGTWLSGEELDDPGGYIWECDPLGVKPGVAHQAMGRFKHEAAAVDPVGRRVYLTEDLGDGGLYRYTPDAYPDLSRGTLEVACGQPTGKVTWTKVPDPSAAAGPLRKQVPGMIVFQRGEGIFYDTGVVYIATTSDDKIHGYDVATETLGVIYDGRATKDAPLHRVDNVTAHPASGDLFVCEDADDLQICIITADREVAPFVQLSGPLHTSQEPLLSELAGVTFDPSGRHLFFSSQRGALLGMTFMVSGPFRTLDPRRPPALPKAAPGVLRLRAKPAAKLATVRAQGLKVTLEADAPGTYVLELRAGGQTLARATRKVTRPQTLAVRLVPVRRADTARLRGRRISAQLRVSQARRRVTRPITLTRGA